MSVPSRSNRKAVRPESELPCDAYIFFVAGFARIQPLPSTEFIANPAMVLITSSPQTHTNSQLSAHTACHPQLLAWPPSVRLAADSSLLFSPALSRLQ